MHVRNKITQIVLIFASILTVYTLAVSPVLAQTGRNPVEGGLNKIRDPFGDELTKKRDVYEIIKTVINWMLTLAGIIAVIFVIIGGYMYLTSAGNEEQSGKGRKTIINALIGLIIIILSYVIVNVIVSAVTRGDLGT